jgi:SAM-dependent methyltransferase
MVDRGVIDQIIRNEADMAYRRRVQTIFEWLDPQDADLILDAGCGRGFYLQFIRHVSNARMVGMELEFPYLRMARQALAEKPDLLLTNGDLYHLPLSDSMIDKCILSEVLEHVDDDVRVLRSIVRILKPGGLLAITVPNANYPFWWDPINKTLETIFQTHIQNGFLAGIWANHVRLYTHDQLRSCVKSAGLEIVEERSFTHHAFPFIHNIVYGLGKTILEAGLLPRSIAHAADRHNLTGNRGGWLNPVHLGLMAFEWFDHPNQMSEPEGRSTVNLCVLARKPATGGGNVQKSK